MHGLLAKFILMITARLVLIGIDYLHSKCILIVSLVMETLGNIGDFIGGISGFIGTIVAVVVYVYVKKTFKLQKKQLKSQKKELEATRDQLKIQQFENIYFKMLDVINDMGKELKTGEDLFNKFHHGMQNDYLGLLTPKVSTNGRHLGILKKICKENEGIYSDAELDGISSSFTVASTFLGNLHTWREKDILNRTIIILGHIYHNQFLDNKSPFGHYFRYIINVIDYVEKEITFPTDAEKQKKERLRYIKLISAQLSNNQLEILFYSCLSKISYDTNNQPTAKRLMEEYEMFKNLLPENLISPWHQDFYDIPYKFPYNKETEGSDKRI